MERNLSIARLGVLLKVDCKCFRPVRHAPSQEQVLADMETIRNVAGEWLWNSADLVSHVLSPEISYTHLSPFLYLLVFSGVLYESPIEQQISLTF